MTASSSSAGKIDRLERMMDLAEFFERIDRRTRRTFPALMAVSLAPAAGIVFVALPDGATLGELPAGRWFQIGMGPFSIAVLWAASLLAGASRPALPDTPVPMHEDDARNALRVANAGHAFLVGFAMIAIGMQVLVLLAASDVLDVLKSGGHVVVTRVVLALTGALVILFGNAWPRLPVNRSPEQRPAASMSVNRRVGWVLVIWGLALVAAAALAPLWAMMTTALGGCALVIVICVVLGMRTRISAGMR